MSAVNNRGSLRFWGGGGGWVGRGGQLQISPDPRVRCRLRIRIIRFGRKKKAAVPGLSGEDYNITS